MTDLERLVQRIQRRMEGHTGSVTIHYLDGKPRKLEFRDFETLSDKENEVGKAA